MEKEKIEIQLPINLTIEGEIDLGVLKDIIHILKEANIEIEKFLLTKIKRCVIINKK